MIIEADKKSGSPSLNTKIVREVIVLKYIFLFLTLCIVTGCNNPEVVETKNVEEMVRHVHDKETIQPKIDVAAYNREPREWGEQVTGVKNRFITDQKEIALTFDLCGGKFGSDYDEALVEFLRAAEVPATLFVNEQWIQENQAIFLELADDPLFQIENHGTNHAPLSVNGNEAWGIPGTNSAEEAGEEIMKNFETVKELTGREMSLFRSGTAYYDEVAVELANALGFEVVNYDILGDAGATYTAAQVQEALLLAEPGSIALLHMNQPESGTAEGVKQAVPLLRAEGFEFVQLDDKELE